MEISLSWHSIGQEDSALDEPKAKFAGMPLWNEQSHFPMQETGRVKAGGGLSLSAEDRLGTYDSGG